MSDEEDWPYEKIEVVEPLAEPSWLCPDEKCSCSEKEHDHEPYTCSVMLTDPTGARMPGARVRVVVNGILVNPDKPNADGGGWISVELRRKPDSMQVEWAPKDTPDRPELPYRKLYYVDLHEHQPEEAVRRRLHNLGFMWLDSLRKNIQDFQCEFGAPKITGEVEDVEEQLESFHDAAMLPVVKRRDGADELDPLPPHGASGRPRGGWDTSVDAPSQPFQLAAFDGDNNPKSPGNNLPPPPPPPPGMPGPTGTVRPAVGNKFFNMSSILEVIDQGFADVEWWPIEISTKSFDAIFWVFKDALKHKTTGRRWPCSAHEARLACDKLQSTPSNLPGWPTEADSPSEPLSSVFLTTMLSDVRWAKAESAGQAIEPIGGLSVTGDQLVENGKLNVWVDSQMQPGWTAADPGKVWVLVERMFGVTIAGLPAAVNYGWHVQSAKVKETPGDKHAGKYKGAGIERAATPAGQWCLQWEEMGHNTAWIDYSQLLILASGWCATRASGATAFSADRTEEVYKSAAKAALVTADGKPLSRSRQPVPLTPEEIKAQKEAQAAFQRATEIAVREARILMQSQAIFGFPLPIPF